MTSPVEWSPARRIGFRFAFLAGALLVFPFPIDLIPKVEWPATVLRKPLEWATHWLAIDVLGLPVPYPGPNGSGDRAIDYAQVLLIALLAGIGTVVWSVLDRRRRAYPRLAAAAWVVLRYYLAAVMLNYGLLKVARLQFSDPSPGTLHQRLGETPPMRLLWTFMGYSRPYTVFAGLAETVGAALLLWRRTATIGALIVTVVMTNVVMLNLCYDVPVKIFASELVAMAIAIALPDARRLISAALGGAAPELPPRLRASPWRERARLVAKVVLIALMVFAVAEKCFERRHRNERGQELYGNWIVDGFVVDSVDHPPLTTDPERWECWSAGSTSMSIWRMDGAQEGRADPDRGWYGLAVDAAAHTITVTVDYATQRKETWRYALTAPDRLVIDGVHRGKPLHVALHLEPEGALLSRGFHWFNEVPYNR